MASSSKSHQLVKQCRIFQWLESKDSEFAGAIRDLCLEGALSPGRDAPGITFLYPEQKLRDEIVKLAYSTDAEKASTLIQSLIIPDSLPTGADFNRVKSLGNRCKAKFTVKNVEGNKVTLDGFTLKAAAGFSPLGDRKIAVWEIVEGRPSCTASGYEPPRGTGAKMGGNAPMRAGESPRMVLAEKLEKCYLSCMKSGNLPNHDPYLGTVVSLLNYLKTVHPAVFENVKKVIDYNPVVTFYLIVEPYKTSGPFLIPENIIFGDDGWNNAEIFTKSNVVENYKDFFAGMGASGNAVDSERQKLESYKGIGLVEHLHAAYKTDTHEGAKELWQDEFRFTIHSAMQNNQSSEFESIVTSIRECWPGNNYLNELLLCNKANIKSNCAPRTVILMIGVFIDSTDFMYTPVAPESVGTWGSRTPGIASVYNRNAAALEYLSRTSMMKSTGLSARAKAELAVYKAINGSQSAV